MPSVETSRDTECGTAGDITAGKPDRGPAAWPGPRWQDADGQVQDATEWRHCVAWGILAEVCAQYVTMGSRVYVAGRLQTVRWQDSETGERHTRVEMVLDDLILLDRRGGAATDDGTALSFSP